MHGDKGSPASFLIRCRRKSTCRLRQMLAYPRSTTHSGQPNAIYHWLPRDLYHLRVEIAGRPLKVDYSIIHEYLEFTLVVS